MSPARRSPAGARLLAVHVEAAQLEVVRFDCEPEALVLAPGERVEVLIDFSELPVGTVVRLINTGPDGPFRGFDDDAEFVPADPNSTGQVMEFHVVADDKKIGEQASSPYSLKLSLADAKDPANLVKPHLGLAQKLVATTRDFALLDENSSLICADTVGDECQDCTPVNGVCIDDTDGNPCQGCTPFGPIRFLLGTRGNASPLPALWANGISANPSTYSTEVWEFWNWALDAHAIHLHLVKFRVLQRFEFTTQDGQTVLGEEVPADPVEDGWKDTVLVHPGQVVSIAATFDINGLYMWHGNMLEPEDNEMRLPFCVGDETKAPGCAAVH